MNLELAGDCKNPGFTILVSLVVSGSGGQNVECICTPGVF